MIVVFQSESENKSITRVARVLDAYANRIGRRSWMTAITSEGLDSVYHELRRIATKDTAVSCLLVKGKMQKELLWIVGRRDRFDSQGNVPVNGTANKKYSVVDENIWKYAPLITASCGFAALWHDAGKSSKWFQDKLRRKASNGDPLRHDWMSCMILFGFIKSVKAENDEQWLDAMQKGLFDEKAIISEIQTLKTNTNHFFRQTKGYPVFNFIAWLILSHHRLPGAIGSLEKVMELRPAKISTFERLLDFLTPDLGYISNEDSSVLTDVFSFPDGFSFLRDMTWTKQVAKWAGRLAVFDAPINDLEKNNILFEVLMLARSSLVLSDHEQSAKLGTASSDKNAQIANLRDGGIPNQTLVEHLLSVASRALNISYLLPRMNNDLERVHDIKSLKMKSPEKFAWQDRGVSVLKEFAKRNSLDEAGCFIVNMASTGCGKTLANMKALNVLSKDNSIRCSVLLGLRTLTLQTGKEYKTRMGLSEDDLHVVVGSKAFVELSQALTKEKGGVDEDSDCITASVGKCVSSDETILGKLPLDEKSVKLISTPVLVSTIDQIIGASEATIGAHNIVPLLRLMGSDLVIDEVDDYSGDDLVAIGRLVYLCGVFGKKIVISSATVPPEVSIGLAAAYQHGWSEHVYLHGGKKKVLCVLMDEFKTSCSLLEASFDCSKEGQFRNAYREFLKEFVNYRIRKLQEVECPRKGEIIQIEEATKQGYFAAIDKERVKLHFQHREVDPHTGKGVSFGLIRFSNIKQCIEYSRHVVTVPQNGDVQIRFTTYHAREVMLIRQYQEQYLDRILSRKVENKVFDDLVIRQHIENTNGNEIMFVVISSPVEELGRDHDFDWAIIEPASLRSIIQTSGRVLRHRSNKNTKTNIGILSYNWKCLKDYAKDDAVYCRPGFETRKDILPSHNVADLIDSEYLRTGINAIPRISFSDDSMRVSDFQSLEHHHVSRIMNESTNRIVDDFAAYYTTPVVLTAFSQTIHSFRKDTYGGFHTEVFLMSQGGRQFFIEENVGEVTGQYGIKIGDRENSLYDWLPWVYDELVDKFSEQTGMSPRDIQLKYGGLCFPCLLGKNWKYSDRFGLEEAD